MTESDNRHEVSVVTDGREIESYKQEIARLKQLVVQLSEIVLRNVIKQRQSRKSEHP
ncbi:hypothetical protein [Bradyrhizobium iriomotense]|uniref:Uncharacterized protein n=1 Tax=Bradyrhizobium iriomotense TaxID=441950 RepID=A0ABQ6BJE6_9BRAD|nr:hypothetical protein [Bradyrhizobium iriomotense]GLR92243.1 hypothetical protein GCM10007857_89640 [Bradyrhizobium iriomotense]